MPYKGAYLNLGYIRRLTNLGQSPTHTDFGMKVKRFTFIFYYIGSTLYFMNEKNPTTDLPIPGQFPGQQPIYSGLPFL